MEISQIWLTLITTIILLGLYYLAIIPKKQQENKIKKMQDELKKGDKVVTYTGLSGEIDEIIEDRIILITNPDKVKLSIEKWAVAGLDDRKID